MNGNRFHARDGLRGVCALLVVLYHGPRGSHLGRLDLVQNAYLFVDFFFVLSGFVLSHGYYLRLRDGLSPWRFAARRLARLWPLHLATLAGFVLLDVAGRVAGLKSPPFDSNYFWSLAANLALVHSLGWEFPSHWNVPSWSISVEFYFCVVFALLARYSRRWMVPAAVALVLGSLAMLLRDPEHMKTTQFGIFRCTAGFLLGHFVWRLWRNTVGVTIPAPSVGEATAALLAVVFVWRADASPGSVAAPFVFAVLVYALARGEGAISRLLASKPLLRLGQYSYGLYLTHVLVMVTFADVAYAVTMLTRLPVYTALTAGVAEGTRHVWLADAVVLLLVALSQMAAVAAYWWVERPFIAPGREEMTFAGFGHRPRRAAWSNASSRPTASLGSLAGNGAPGRD
jgi:peptidoglycan/LPS O-acetylase OafA/YrhL